MNYSAKVSDLESAGSSSAWSNRQSPVLRNGSISHQCSAQVSSSEDEESESDTSIYSETESELSVDVERTESVFLTQGKDVDGDDSLQKPEPNLFNAVKNNDLTLVRKIISNRCDIDGKDSNSRTALHVACSFGRLEIVRLLVEEGANVDAASSAGQTPLHEACIGGRYKVLQEMISEVADLDMIDLK